MIENSEPIAGNVQSSGQEQFIRREQVFQFLGIAAQAIAQTFGSQCEVVVHDFADPEHSIVSIFGNLTDRKVGGSLDDLGLSILESGLPGEHVLIYETFTPAGKRLKSTSAILRDSEGCLFAALCININSDSISQAAALLADLCRIPVQHTHVVEHFADDPADVITGIFHEELAKRNIKDDGHKLKREERIEIIQSLRERGVFNMRSAPTIVADLLKVSRFTIYNYINEVNSRNNHTT